MTKKTKSKAKRILKPKKSKSIKTVKNSFGEVIGYSGRGAKNYTKKLTEYKNYRDKENRYSNYNFPDVEGTIYSVKLMGRKYKTGRY